MYSEIAEAYWQGLSKFFSVTSSKMSGKKSGYFRRRYITTQCVQNQELITLLKEQIPQDVRRDKWLWKDSTVCVKI